MFYLEDNVRIVGVGEEMLIPKGVVHTFRNASLEEDLVLEFGLEPRDGGGVYKGRDERFFSMLPYLLLSSAAYSELTTIKSLRRHQRAKSDVVFHQIRLRSIINRKLKT